MQRTNLDNILFFYRGKEILSIIFLFLSFLPYAILKILPKEGTSQIQNYSFNAKGGIPLNLSQQCRQFTRSDFRQLKPTHPLASRLVCPEYSKSAREVKPYAFIDKNRVFFLCWDFSNTSCLRATMYPAADKNYYAFQFQDGTKTQLHTHDYIELGYVVKGSFKQRICDKDILFSEGDFCLIDKNCIHQDYLIQQESIVLFFGIENEIFHEILNENVSTQKIISFLQTALMKQNDLQQYMHFRPFPNAREKMEKCLSLLLEELCESDTGSALICKGLLLRIFRLLSSTYEVSLSREQQKTMNWIIFENINDYIQEHYQTVTIQELTELFHFQKDYFNRLIKKKTGMTYSEYLQSIRLAKAEQFLLSTDASVSEIAEMVGYHNKGFFYKIFTNRYGMTPAEYRILKKRS